MKFMILVKATKDSEAGVMPDEKLLTEMGCNHIQGWLVCQALPSEELARRFEAQQLRLHAA